MNGQRSGAFWNVLGSAWLVGLAAFLLAPCTLTPRDSVSHMPTCRCEATVESVAHAHLSILLYRPRSSADRSHLSQLLTAKTCECVRALGS